MPALRVQIPQVLAKPDEDAAPAAKTKLARFATADQPKVLEVGASAGTGFVYAQFTGNFVGRALLGWGQRVRVGLKNLIYNLLTSGQRLTKISPKFH